MNIVIPRKFVLLALLSIAITGFLTSLIFSPSKVLAQGAVKQFNVEAKLEAGGVPFLRVVDPDTGAKCYVQINSDTISCIK